MSADSITVRHMEDNSMADSKFMGSFEYDIPSTPSSRRRNSVVSFLDDLSCIDIANDKFLQYNSPETNSSYDSDDDGDFNVLFDMSQASGCVEHTLPSPANTLTDWSPTSLPASPVPPGNEPQHPSSFYTIYHLNSINGSASSDLADTVATNFATALSAPVCSHVALARSALRRLTMIDSSTEDERKALEIAVMYHKGQAIRIIRKLHERQLRTKSKHADQLLASIVSLATLDRCTGYDQTADLHHMAVRRTLASIAGPANIESVLLSRVMVHLEFIHGSTIQSYCWGQNDMTRLLGDLNAFFARLYNLSRTQQRQRSTVMPMVKKGKMCQVANQQEVPGEGLKPLHSFGPKQGSVLRSTLEHQTFGTQCPSSHDRLELVCQLATILTLCTVILDHSLDCKILQTYVDKYHSLVETLQTQDQPSSVALWLLQIHDQSEHHLRRSWQVAGWIWLLKHVNYNVQLSIKDNAMRFLDGIPVEKAFHLNSFHFSYAS